MIAVILAAGMAKRLRPLTDNTPKCLLDVKGRSLLERSMDAIVAAGVRDFVIVTGYLNHMIENFVKEHYGDSIRVTFIHNARYDSTNNIYSLWLAGQAVAGKEFLLLDSDLLYDPQIVKNVLASKAANVLTLIRHELGEEEMKVVLGSDGNIFFCVRSPSVKSEEGRELTDCQHCKGCILADFFFLTIPPPSTPNLRR